MHSVVLLFWVGSHTMASLCGNQLWVCFGAFIVLWSNKVSAFILSQYYWAIQTRNCNTIGRFQAMAHSLLSRESCISLQKQVNCAIHPCLSLCSHTRSSSSFITGCSTKLWSLRNIRYILSQDCPINKWFQMEMLLASNLHVHWCVCLKKDELMDSLLIKLGSIKVDF